jgi:DNA repair exonuclease SbcCD ATPase subunit
MLISHVILRNFGKFENFSCDFRPGLNLIKGPNESGKSTLANAIAAALFLNPSEKPKEVTSAANWASSKQPSLEAIFDIGGRSYKLIKDFERGVAELEDETIGIKQENPSSIDSWLSDHIGIPSEQIFNATACIRQGDISHIDDSFEAIKDKLESLITGGREEKAASNLISKVERRIETISGEDDGISGGELGQLNIQADEINYNIEKLTREIASLKAKRADLIQVEMALRNVSEDLQTKKEKLEKSKRAVRLEDDFLAASSESREIETKLAEAQESLKKIKGLRDRQAGLKSFDNKDIQDVTSIESELSYLHPKRHELQDESTEASEEFEAYKIGEVYIICIAAGVIGSIVSGLTFFTSLLGFFRPFAGYGLVASIVILALGAALTITRGQHRTYLKTRSEKLKTKLSDLDEEYQKQSAILNTLLAKYSVHTVDELKRSIWQYDDIEKQIIREKELYDSILSGQTMQELEQRKESLTDVLAQLNREKRELAHFNIDDEELGRLNLIVSQYEERLKDLERERLAIRQQIETAEGGAELLSSYKERHDKIRAQAEGLLRQIAILRLTANCIDEARQNVLVSTLEVLNVRTSDILNKLTSGRYSKVRFDKSTMKFEVFSDDRSEWVDPYKGLSAGTVDQIYLAARLALAELVSEEKNSMIILDDPFANYDEKRLENAMKVIKELSESHQVLLLTSQNHYDKWADCTIAL